MSTVDNKQRHGCLTALLIFMMVVNAATALVYLFGKEMLQQGLQNMPAIPDWAFPVLALLGAFNLVCAIALFSWKKWGFYGFALSSVLAFTINLTIGIPMVQALMGFVGLAILYGVLQIGNGNKGWPQLD
jgi:hypothetical protein